GKREPGAVSGCPLADAANRAADGESARCQGRVSLASYRPRQQVRIVEGETMSTMRRWAATLVAAAAAGLLGSGPAWGATAQAGTITEIRSAAGAAKCVGLADNGSTA